MNNKNLAVFEIYFVAKVNDKVGTFSGGKLNTSLPLCLPSRSINPLF